MRINKKRNGPGATPEAVYADQMNSREAASHSIGTSRIPHLSASEIAASRPLYLLIVKTPSDRLTRRCYLSLHAAEKACRRARERGSAATLEMHRVVPYTVGAELHGLEAGGPR